MYIFKIIYFEKSFCTLHTVILYVTVKINIAVFTFLTAKYGNTIIVSCTLIKKCSKNIK